MDRRAFLGLGVVAPAIAITPTPEPEQKSVIWPKERLEYLAELKQLRERLDNLIRANLTLLDMGFTTSEAERCRKDLAKRQNSSRWRNSLHRNGLSWYLHWWLAKSEVFRTHDSRWVELGMSEFSARMEGLFNAILVTFRTGLDGFALLDIETPWLVRNEYGVWERRPCPKLHDRTLEEIHAARRNHQEA